MNRTIILTLAVLMLFVLGAGATFIVLRAEKSAPVEVPDSGPELVELGEGHGKAVVLSENPEICEHRIPEARCPFCRPELIETLGYCRGHDVAEALCTRCSPVLIAAFKTRGDWCEEHGMPESQCDHGGSS